MLSEQEKKELKYQIKSNQHEVFVVSIEEMDAIVKSSPKGNVQNTWQKLKNKAEVGASYYASVDDLRTLSKLVGDLGGFATKAYVKTYGGKPHIILKGHSGLRRVLTGTKYGIKNPKVITMGLGKAGAIHAAKFGGILSVVLLSTYRVADYFLTDTATLSQLIGYFGYRYCKSWHCYRRVYWCSFGIGWRWGNTRNRAYCSCSNCWCCDLDGT